MKTMVLLIVVCSIKYIMVNHHTLHDDVMKWKHFPHYWPFVRGIHRSLVNSPHKGQWRGAFMFTLICVWINGCVNNREAGDLRRYRVHYDITLMSVLCFLLHGYSWPDIAYTAAVGRLLYLVKQWSEKAPSYLTMVSKWYDFFSKFFRDFLLCDNENAQ